MAQPRISERKAPRAGEGALARLPQTRHHTDVACERGGIPKSARVAQLCDQACGSPCADAVNGGKEFANFVILELALDFLLKLLHATSQELYVRAGVFHLQLVRLRVMISYGDLGVLY
jgi:hypothetical protein